MNDTINVFQNPVDSVRVAAQDVTSDQITNMLNVWESVVAFVHLFHLEYVALVCISYYVIVTRIPFIKTNAMWKRNVCMFLLIIGWGLFGYYYRGTPFLNILVTGLCTTAFYEFIFKGFFRLLERWGITPLPEWHSLEIKDEKMQDIKRAEDLTKKQ